MKIVVDVGYRENHACAAGILFAHWQSDCQVAEVIVRIDTIAPYVSGKFFSRELPCILAVLDRVDFPLNCIVIDGYVFLGADQKPGLGKYVWDAVGQRIPIIGIAKSKFKYTPAETEILRGRSKRPLYVTSIGIDLETAKKNIAAMHGPNRIPTLLTRVDQLTKM